MQHALDSEIDTDSPVTSSIPKEERLLRFVQSPEKAIRALCDRHFSRFLREFWPYVSTSTLKWNWHLDVLCDDLQMLAECVAFGYPFPEGLRDRIYNVPPGTTKSVTVSTLFPPWCWSRWPWMRFLASSYSADLSLDHAENSRDVVRSEKFRVLYPDVVIKKDRDAKSNFGIMFAESISEDEQEDGIEEKGERKGGNRISTSVGGTTTGRHADFILVDDPLDPNRAASEKELANANHYMDQTLPTRKVDKERTPTVLIMQRLHQDDPTGHWLEKKKKNVKHICLPGEIRNYRKKVNPPELVQYYKNDLLDPVRMNWKVLEDLEADLGQYGYAGQIGQDPTPPKGGMFHIDEVRVITEMPAEVNIMEVARYWDKAGTEAIKNPKAAYTVGTKMCRLRNGKFVVMDVVRGQWSSEVRERIIRQTAEADGTSVRIYIEQEPGSGGKESAEGSIKNLAGFAVFRDIPTGDKSRRADPFSVQVNAGNVLMLHGEWNHNWKEEFRYFPFGTYKDQVDSGSGAFNKIAVKRRGGMITKRRT